jgi:hypothetical protein
MHKLLRVIVASGACILAGYTANPTRVEVHVSSAGTALLDNLQMMVKCSNCDPDTGAGSADYYMATAGNLTVIQLSPFAASLTDATFEHVTIDTAGSPPPLTSITMSSTVTDH